MNDTRFKKGFIPWNKGMKTGLKPTNGFKKGNRPWHTRELYSERLDKEGYTIIKIAEPNKWMRKHRWIYEQKNGKISKDSTIIFADGNKENFNIENLILVSRAELAILVRCRLISSISELTKSGVAVAKLKAKLNELRKEKTDGK